MNYSKYRFNLDMQSYISQISLPVRQHDTGISLRINLTDGGVPYVIKDGCRAVFYARKADGNPLMNDCVIEKNTTICYELTQQTTACSGVVDCEVRLYGTDGNLITTPRFILVIDSRVVHDEDFPLSDSEQTTLDNIILRETTRIANEEAREEAEAERQETAERAKELVERLEAQAPIKHGEGENSFIGNDTDNNQAIGLNSEAYGSFSNAIGEASHSEGLGTSPMPEFADKNEALEKWNTTKFHAAVGYNSRVQGKDCIALGTTAFAQGLENAAVGNRAVALGNGNTAKGNNSFACGSKNVVEGLDAGAIGQSNTVNTGKAYAFGYNNVVSGSGSGAIGSNNITHSTHSYAFGGGNSVGGTGSSAIGNNNIVNGSSCYAIGDNNSTEGVGSATIGMRNQTTQGNCFAFGRDNTLTAFSAYALGMSNTVAHKGAQVFGLGLKSSRDYQTVIGTHNVDNSDALFIIGKGSSSYPYNAFEVIDTKDKGVGIRVGNTLIYGSQLTEMTNNFDLVASYRKAGAYEWTCPEDGEYIALIVGGGGSGCSYSVGASVYDNYYGATGGKHGDFNIEQKTFQKGIAIPLVVGAGGEGVTFSISREQGDSGGYYASMKGHSGNAGGTSSFNGITADGGSAGYAGIRDEDSSRLLPSSRYNGWIWSDVLRDENGFLVTMLSDGGNIKYYQHAQSAYIQDLQVETRLASLNKKILSPAVWVELTGDPSKDIATIVTPTDCGAGSGSLLHTRWNVSQYYNEAKLQGAPGADGGVFIYKVR